MDDDYLPISMLNAFTYCPRRFYYEHVLGEMLVNAHVLEGQIRHERTHTSGVERQDDLTIRRGVRVYSDRWQLIGVIDLVEEQDGLVVPIEYKKGRGGRWLNDEVQLCAAALCLEERLQREISHGFVFYFAPRRRTRVDFTASLRATTAQTIEEARLLARSSHIPPPLPDNRRCRDCSLEPLCLPQEVRQLTGARG